MNAVIPQDRDPQAETAIERMFRDVSVPLLVDRQKECVSRRPEAHWYTATPVIAVDGEQVSENRIHNTAAQMGCGRALDRLLVMTALKTLRECPYIRRLMVRLSVVSSPDSFLAEFAADAFAAQSVDPDRFAIEFPETTNTDCPEVRATLCRWESERFEVMVRGVALATPIATMRSREIIGSGFDTRSIVY